MYESDNMKLECFLTTISTIVIIYHKRVWVIIKLNKKARGHRGDKLYFQLLLIIQVYLEYLDPKLTNLLR